MADTTQAISQSRYKWCDSFQFSTHEKSKVQIFVANLTLEHPAVSFIMSCTR